VAGDVATTVAPGAGLHYATSALSFSGFDGGLDLSATLDADRYVHESALLSSPQSFDLEYDHLAGDDTEALSSFFDEFVGPDDFHVAPSNEQQPQQQSFNCAVADSSLHNLETPNSSEDSYLQPQSGASFVGCDDGGIAVGVI